MNRRIFIEQSGRGLFYGGLALVSFIAMKREGFNEESCNNRFICKKCRKLSSCEFPEAKKVKK